MSNLKIQKLQKKYVQDVFEIESSLIGKCSLDSIEKTLESETLAYYVLLDENQVVGFFECSIVSPEAELFDIAIKKGYQGKGYSKILMNYFFVLCKQKHVETIFLEVNSINNVAINLYKNFGFEKYHERKNYYGDNDAILMKYVFKIWFCGLMNFVKFGSSKNFIVFLHGWGGSIDSFLWTKNYFPDFSLLYVDFAGFGKTPEPSKAYLVFDYASELKNLLSEFEIENLILVGHSFGGRIAIKFCHLFQNEYPSLKICLIDSAGIKPKRGILYRIKIWHYKRLKRRVSKNERLKKKLEKFGSSDYKKLSDIMKLTFIKIVNEDLSENAKTINCKTLIVWGDKDKETKPYMAKKLHKLIKNSKLIMFKNAGHFSYLDKREDFLFILDTFVRN